MILFSLEIAFTVNLLEQKPFKMIVDIFFIFLTLDFLIKFKTSYYESGTMVKNHKAIAINYLKHGFIFDMIALLSMLIYVFFAGENSCKWIILLFLLKANNIRSIMQNFENYIDLGDFFEFFSLLFKVIFMAHIYACFWHYISFDSVQNGDKDTWIHEKNLENSSWQQRYIYSFYWALTTMVTVGYGDITPQNEKEIIFCSFSLLSGSVVYGYFLNRIGVLLTRFDEKDKELRYFINLYYFMYL